VELEIITQEPKSNPRQTPVLFVHGAWHGAWCWEENFLPYFAENGYRAHALSLRGHGGSESVARFRLTRLADYVADVAQVVDQLDKTPILIGHSMGGLVVQKYLEAHTVPAAVLMASIPIKGVFHTTQRIARRHPLAFLKANLTWSLYHIVGKPHLAREAFFSVDIPSNKFDGYFSRITDESYLAYLDMMIFSLANPEKITTKLLVLGAENDMIFYPDEVEATAKAYGTRVEIFPKMAHNMMLEADWKSVADYILNWFELEVGK
jgi:pimeloyl-ACP methyl ester carboxylesterase